MERTIASESGFLLRKIQPKINEIWELGEDLSNPETYKFVHFVIQLVLSDLLSFITDESGKSREKVLNLFLKDLSKDDAKDMCLTLAKAKINARISSKEKITDLVDRLTNDKAKNSDIIGDFLKGESK